MEKFILHEVAEKVLGESKLVLTETVEKHPLIFICGPGRSGKDILSLYLYYTTDLLYRGTTSLCAMGIVYTAYRELCNRYDEIINNYPLIYEYFKDCPFDAQTTAQEFYKYRHTCRLFWFDMCNAFRDVQINSIVDRARFNSNLLVGLRSKRELYYALKYPDLVIWVDNGQTDPTLEYNVDDIKSILGELGRNIPIDQYTSYINLPCFGFRFQDLCLKYRFPVKFVPKTVKEILQADYGSLLGS